MIIEGREIKWNNTDSTLDQSHVPYIKDAVRQVVSTFKHIESYEFTQSTLTDSVYVKLRFKKLSTEYTLSIRSHHAKYRRNSYIYICVPNYDTLEDLQVAIREELTTIHNDLTYKQKEIEKTLQPRRGLKKKRRKLEEVRQPNYAKYVAARNSEHSFQQFLEEFNRNKQQQEQTIC